MSTITFRVLAHDEVDSTNARALAALDAGEARHGDVHWALAQTAGRGRRGASWWSPKGEGLYLTVVLAPERPYSAPGLTMAAGLAVRDALRDHGLLPGRGLLLKWPNDVVFGAAKLAGILVEARGIDTGAPKYAVGIGVNVLQTVFPEELSAARPVASLAALGRPATVESVRDAVLARLSERLAALGRDPDALAADYLVATRLQGRHVRVSVGEETFEAVLVSISIAKGLRLQIDSGETFRALEHITALEDHSGRFDRLGRR